MLSKRSRLVTVWTVVVLLSLLWTVAVYAETGPSELMVPGDWQEITDSQVHWYAFEYDSNTGVDKTDDPTYALVRMFVTEPENGAVFTVWTQEQIDDLAEFDPNEVFVPDKWLGCGAFNDSDSIKGDYLWAGNTLNDGMYYVQVERSGLDPDAVYYKLDILGEDVTIVNPAATGIELAESPAAAPVMEEKAVAKAETAAVVAKVGKDDLVPTISLTPGEWRELQVDEEWFAFNYNANYGIDGEGDPNQMFIRMWIDGPENGAEFSVWDKEGLKKLYTYDKDRAPENTLCIGCGAFTEAVSADYVWEGNFKASDTYYVRVMPTGLNTTEPILYKLVIEGEDVAIVTPTAAVAAAVPAMEAEPVAAEAEMAMEAAPAAEAETSMQAEVASAEMEPAIGEWMALQPAQEHWYTFDYRADFGIDGDANPSNVEIAMFVEEPENGAEFTVWTAEQLKKLNEWDPDRNYDDLCVGCGTLNDAVDPDYTWSGNFKSSGTYYVRVKPTGLNTGTVLYKLDISGDDIAF